MSGTIIIPLQWEMLLSTIFLIILFLKVSLFPHIHGISIKFRKSSSSFLLIVSANLELPLLTVCVDRGRK
jgi:hypothetical protein